MGRSPQVQRNSLEIAELSVQSMQAALSTAAALAAAGAVNSPHTQIRATALASAPKLAGSQQRTVVQHHVAPGIMNHLVPSMPPAMTAPIMAATTMTSSTHKSLYAAYNVVAQQQQQLPIAVQQQQPSTVPILFPVNEHVIPHSSSTNNTQVSTMFDSMKLRRGKWTSEEEVYAELLIKEFEKGTVEGCENGCTLRSFLSKRLHCAPMRISKKYAGKSIGKHVFLSRSTVNGIGKADLGGTNNKSKVRELEIKFYKSLFRETESSIAAPPFLYNPVMHPGHKMMGSSVNPYATAPSFMPYNSQGQAPMHWPTLPTEVSTEQQHRNQLHQTFLSVLHQNPMATAPGAPTPYAPGAPTPYAPGLVVAPRVQSTEPKTVSPNTVVPLAHRVPGMPQVHQVVPHTSVQHLTVQTQQPQGVQMQTQPPMQLQASTHPHFQDMSGGTIDLPDFLSGFDKVAARSGESTQQPTMSYAHNSNGRPASFHTPPFTSRSFDDFHQLLGKGLSPKPLDLNNAYRGFPQSPFDSNLQPNATHAADFVPGQPPVTADSYALFAQQSALAVSQHSAYCSKDSSSVPLPILSATPNAQQGLLPPVMFTPSVVNAANLRAHSEAQRAAKSNVVSGSEKSDWGASTEESGSTGLMSRNSDNSSDNTSNDNDSDSLSVEGPQRKKMKVEHQVQQQAPIYFATPGQ